MSDRHESPLQLAARRGTWVEPGGTARGRRGRKRPTGRWALGRPACQQLESRRLLAQVAGWSFDEGSGTRSLDQSGGSTTLTLTGSVVWQSAGRVGGGLAFDGSTGQYGSGGAVVGSAGTLAASLWLRPNYLNRTQIPLDKTPAAGSSGWRIEINQDASVSFRIGSGTTFARISSGTNVFTWGQWVAVAVNFSNSVATLYVNGQQAAQSGTLSVGTAETATTLRVGSPSVFSTGFGFSGTIDELEIYDTPLTATALATQYSVDQLPEDTTANRLKKASLAWGVEDAIRDESSGYAARAAVTYGDVQARVGVAYSGPRPSPSNFFPTIPSYSTNPIVADTISRLTTLRNSTYRPDKDPTNYKTNVFNGDVFGSWYSDAMQGSWALGTAQTSLYADTRLLTVVLRRLQGVFEGTPTVYTDFFNSPGIAQAYVLFKSVYGDLILPSKQSQWEAVLKADADAVYNLKASTFFTANPATSYFNSDVGYVSALRWNYETFPTQTNYYTAAEAGVNFLASVVYPDGGQPYIATQNDVYTYHGIGVLNLSRYYQAFGNTTARDIVLKSYWYFPLSIEPPGVVEYTTAASWKHYWNAVKWADAAYIVGSMAQSPENLAVWKTISGNSFAGIGTLQLASYYTTLQPGTLADNYITYDRNILGARGRFGQYSFSLTGNPVAGDNRGKPSFVGSMLLNPGTSGWTLNAGVDSVQSRVRLRADGTSYADSTQNESNSYTVTPRFASLTSVNNLAAYKQSPLTNWRGTQQWIQTPNRMVGFVGVQSLASQTAFALEGAIELVSGRSTWGTQKQLIPLDGTSNAYQYGGLIVRILQQDYAAVQTSLIDTWGNDGARKSGLINLIDSRGLATGGTTSSTYPAGTSQYFMVEIYPTNSGAGSNYVRLSSGSLTGFEFTDSDNRGYRIVQNPTNAPLTYTASVTWSGGAVVHLNGETYRPDWLSTYDLPDTDFRGRWQPATTAYGVAAGTYSFTIPAWGHLVLESNRGPTVVSNASAGGTSVSARSTTLSVAASDDAGPAGLTYTWAVQGTPPGNVTFSGNSSAAAGNTSVTFSAAGTYALQVLVTDAGGLSASSSVTVTVNQTPTAVSVTPGSLSLAQGQAVGLSAALVDQFGLAINGRSFTWSATGGTVSPGGSGAASLDATFTAGQTAGKSYSITATTGTLAATVPVIVRPPAPVFAGLVVNDGSAQRSRVTQVVVSFSQPVTLGSGGLNLSRRGGGFAGLFSVSPVGTPASSFTVSFTGSGVVAGSLPDGIYDLALNALAATDDYGQSASSNSYSFHRLFGDSNGDGKVDSTDLVAMSNAYAATYDTSAPTGSPLAAFDFDGNGVINNVDLLYFRKRYGTSLL